MGHVGHIAKEGGIAAVVGALQRHQDHAGVAEQACGALRRLASNGESASRTQSAGGVVGGVGVASASAAYRAAVPVARPGQAAAPSRRP